MMSQLDLTLLQLPVEAEITTLRESPHYSSIQDSAIGGDLHVGATHNVSTTINDPEAIARAAIEAYRMAMEDQR